MTTHTLTMLGGNHEELRVPAAALCEALLALIDSARHATRFAVEGESLRKGPRPAWLDLACNVEVTSVAAGSAIIALDARPLREVDPAKFGSTVQAVLFDDQTALIGDQTAIDVLGTSLAAVIEGENENLAADRPLLESFARFARVAAPGYHGLALAGLRNRRQPLVVTPAHVEKIERLRDKTPTAQAVRVSGTLDTISVSRADVVLTLADGSKIPARLDNCDPAVLQQLFGQLVVVVGMAHFRPSGKLFFIDVESLAPATAADQLFAKPPVARRGVLTIPPLPQSAVAGVAAFFGTWPGDESDDELLQALRAIE